MIPLAVRETVLLTLPITGRNNSQGADTMSNSILWILDGWRYWDKENGNSYHLTRVTHATSGNSAVFDESPDNMHSYINKLATSDPTIFSKTYHRRTHTAPIQEVSYREWQRMLQNSFTKPVQQYEHKQGKSPCTVINITGRILNKLRRKAA